MTYKDLKQRNLNSSGQQDILYWMWKKLRNFGRGWNRIIWKQNSDVQIALIYSWTKNVKYRILPKQRCLNITSTSKTDFYEGFLMKP